MICMGGVLCRMNLTQVRCGHPSCFFTRIVQRYFGETLQKESSANTSMQQMVQSEHDEKLQTLKKQAREHEKTIEMLQRRISLKLPQQERVQVQTCDVGVQTIVQSLADAEQHMRGQWADYGPYSE